MLRMLTVLSALVLFGCEPMGPLPGGPLSGEVQPAPDDWSALGGVEIVQLETRPDDPYSINIWGVGLGKHYYIASGGGGESKWVGYIQANPNVRLRIDDSIFELNAVRVTDEAELSRTTKQFYKKYDMESQGDEAAAEAWLFRLARR